MMPCEQAIPAREPRSRSIGRKAPGAAIAAALVQTGAVVAVVGFVVLILGERLLFGDAWRAAAIRSAEIAVVMSTIVMVAKVRKRR